MRSNRLPVQVLVIFLLVLFYCEYLIYYVTQSECHWPDLDAKNEDPIIDRGKELPARVMVIADTHLLGSRKGHWFDKLRREWQMHRAFQTGMTLHKPDLVFVLGDLTDEGLYCSSGEFENYVKRFYTLFAVPKETELYVLVGNHDIGFHYGISPYLNNRFVNAFNAPAVQLITVRGNHFVLINSMALEGDGCFLCRPAEIQLTRIEKLLKCANNSYIGKCDPDQTLESFSKPILMQHYPLYRESDMECTDDDSAPELIKRQQFREKWECLSKEATHQILNQLRPRLVLGGHTHHGCTRPLATGDGIEITVPSFNWRNKNNPNYGLAVITPNNYAYAKCEMPKESRVLELYMITFTLALGCLGYWIYNKLRRRRCKYN